MTVRCIGPRDPYDPESIDTTSRSRNWSRGLSPFILGPVPLYEGAGIPEATNVENVWQFSKLYEVHTDEDDKPTQEYWDWARKGWSDPKAHRYPMGKGVRPIHSLWDGEELGYIEARKKIYIPIYGNALVKSEAFLTLLALYREKGKVTLWDFDGYDHLAMGRNFKDVVNDPFRSLGHSFVIAYLLEKLR